MANNEKLITEERLKNLQNILNSTLDQAFAVTDIATRIATPVIFGMEMIFRFARLGLAMREELRNAQKKLDESVRAEGIFRITIQVNMSYAKILSFLKDCNLLYRDVYVQLEPEREVIFDPKHPEWKEAKRILTLASQFLPEIYHDHRFNNNPILDDLFGKWLDPGNPDFRSLFKEMSLFYSKEEISRNDLKQLVPAYTKLKLNLMKARLDNLTEEELDKLNNTIGGLIWDALIGSDDNALKSLVQFSVEQRTQQLQEEINDLTEKENELKKIPENNRTEAQKKELEQIARRKKDLENQQKRISGAH